MAAVMSRARPLYTRAIALDLTPELHTALRAHADRNGTTLAHTIRTILAVGLGLPIPDRAPQRPRKATR